MYGNSEAAHQDENVEWLQVGESIAGDSRTHSSMTEMRVWYSSSIIPP